MTSASRWPQYIWSVVLKGRNRSGLKPLVKGAAMPLGEMDRLPPLSELLLALTSAADEETVLSRLSVRLPVEIDVSSGQRVDVSPATQCTNTTVFPVLHQLTVTLTLADA